MPPVAFAAYSKGSVLVLLHQAPIGIKVLVMFLKHPFRLWRTRISSVPYRVQKRVTILMVFTTTVGLTAWTATVRHFTVSGLGTA